MHDLFEKTGVDPIGPLSTNDNAAREEIFAAHEFMVKPAMSCSKPLALQTAGKGSKPLALQTPGKGSTPLDLQTPGKGSKPLALQTAGKGSKPLASETHVLLQYQPPVHLSQGIPLSCFHIAR